MGACLGRSKVAPSKTTDQPTTNPATQQSQSQPQSQSKQPQQLQQPQQSQQSQQISVGDGTEKKESEKKESEKKESEKKESEKKESEKKESEKKESEKKESEKTHNSVSFASSPPVKETEIEEQANQDSTANPIPRSLAQLKDAPGSRRSVEFKEPTKIEGEQPKKSALKEAPAHSALKKSTVVPPSSSEPFTTSSQQEPPTNTIDSDHDEDEEDEIGEMKESSAAPRFQKHKNSISIIKKGPLVNVPHSSSDVSLDETQSEGEEEAEPPLTAQEQFSVFNSNSTDKPMTRAETMKKLETKFTCRSTKKDLFDRNILKSEDPDSASLYEQNKQKLISEVKTKLEFHLVSRPDVQSLIEMNIAQELNDIEEKAKKKGLHNKAIGRLAKEAMIEKNILSREVTADLAIVEQDMIRSRLLKSPRPYEEPMPTPMLFAPEGDGANLGASINLARTFTKEELMQQSIIPSEDEGNSGPRPLSRRPSLQSISGSRSQLMPDNVPMVSMNTQALSASSGPGELTFAKRRLSRLGPLPTEIPISASGPALPPFPPSSSSSLGASDFPAVIPTRRASFVPTVPSPLVASSIASAIAAAGIEEKEENNSDTEESQTDEQQDEDEENREQQTDEKESKDTERRDELVIYSPANKGTKDPMKA